MVYLLYNEGYTTDVAEHGLRALILLQHARAPARFGADGSVVLLESRIARSGTRR
jgi:predicted RNA polymerase sigma factor